MINLKLHKFLLLFFSVAGLYSSSVFAIVNVEQAIIGPPTEGAHSTLDMLANGASGNTEKSAIKSDLLSLWQHGAQTEFLQIQYAYGQSRGQTDTDRAFTHVRHRSAISPDWAVEEFAQIGRDTFARLTQRRLIGGGWRLILHEEEGSFAGYFGAGAFYEQEMLSEKLGTTDPLEASLWRVNTYLVLKHQLNEQVRLYNTTYYQPATSDASDFRILEQASVLVKLGQHLDVKLNLDISYDSKPAQTVAKRDMLYSTGLEFGF